MEKEKSTCCCGCTFKTGCLIIGSLEMVYSFMHFQIYTWHFLQCGKTRDFAPRGL